ncbi:MAG: hypothetical protein PHE78_00885 [Candidatus Gastranaerophilales bacterium]|nr:hypothetical protein [Candidatus Gastranaerophilales bacterium]
MLNNDSKYILKGRAELNDGKQDLNPDVFTGQITTVKKGSNLKMSVSTILSTGYSESEDEFFAQITNDVGTQDGVIIPAGSFAHGTIENIAKAKRLGRDGYVDLNFDYIITPDGRKIPINASMTTKANPVAATAKNIAKDTGYMLGGGAMGGWVALNMLGLPAAVATHGGTVAGGAGIGAVAGLSIALSQKGKEVLITPGDEMNVEIKSPLELPIMKASAFNEEEIEYKGLNIKIYNIKIEKDPFGEPNVITLSMLIDNQTDKTFSVFDMALLNDLKNIYYPSPFGNTDFWFNRVNPGDKVSTKLSFSVNNPRRKHWLVIYDNYNRQPLIKMSLNNAKRNINNEKTVKRKHNKQDNKNDFYIPSQND